MLGGQSNLQMHPCSNRMKMAVLYKALPKDYKECIEKSKELER